MPSSALREVCILRELKHRNVVRLYDVIYSESKLTLVFEYCDQDLKKFFDSLNGHIDQQVRWIFNRFLGSLRAAFTVIFTFELSTVA